LLKENDSARQIKLGMALSYINIIIGNLIPFFYTPIMLELLGQNEFGLYKLASSTTSYLSLMTFGIGSAVTRYLIKANVEGGKEAEENMLGLFHVIFQVIAVLTIIVGCVIVWKLDVFYGASLTAREIARMRILVMIMVLNTAISFSATSYNAVTTAHEHFIFINVINVISTIVAPVINLIILFAGYLSIEMALASFALNILIRVIYVVYVRHALGIRIRFDKLPVHLVGEIFKFSFWVFVATIVSRINTSTDTVIIGAIPALATAGVAVYSIGSTFSSITFSLAQAASGFFAPRANKMVFSGCTNSELSDLMIQVGRMQNVLVALVCSGFVAFGQPFIEFYAGKEYAEAYWVAVIIMIPNCIPLIQSVALSILQAKNLHRFRSLVYLFIACMNVVGTIFLVQAYGIIGAAIPTGIAYIIGQGLIMNWYYWKRLQLDIPRFWKNMLPMFITATVMCCLTMRLSRIIDFYTPSNLAMGIIVYTIVYCASLWLFVLNDREKKLLFGLCRK